MRSTSELASPKPSIVIHDVTKTFKLRHATSAKEVVVAAFQGKKLSSRFTAVRGVSFDVPQGQSVAIMGKNGSGKSTTLKMVSGVLRPDSGWIRTRGRVAGLLEVGAGFNPNLTGRDNVFLNAAILGMSRAETEAKFDEILEFSEIGEFIDTEVKFYSSGMYARLGFSVAVHTQVDVLLVDEILSVGDAAFREKCNKKMLELRESGTTLFVVSHSVGHVQRLCDRGIVLSQGEIVFDGAIDEAVEFLHPSSTDSGLPFPVSGPIRENYERRSAKYGRPLGPETRVDTPGGGGVFQEFEKGYITSLDNAQASGATFGLTGGPFLAAYRRAGGPQGPWGLIASTIHGGTATFDEKRLEFENGVATYSFDKGFEFERTTAVG